MRVLPLLALLVFVVATLTLAACADEPPDRKEAVATPPPPTIPPGELQWLFSDAGLLEVWDRDANAPLSLVSVLRVIHEANGLELPTAISEPAATNAPETAAAPSASAAAPPAGASTGDRLAAFGDTWGVIAQTLTADIARLVVELDQDWETDITRTYDVSAARTPRGADAAHRGNGNVMRVFADRSLHHHADTGLLQADHRDRLAGRGAEPDQPGLAGAVDSLANGVLAKECHEPEAVGSLLQRSEVEAGGTQRARLPARRRRVGVCIVEPQHVWVAEDLPVSYSGR